MPSLKKILTYAFIIYKLKKHIKGKKKFGSSMVVLFLIDYLYRAFFRQKAKLYFDKNKKNLQILNMCPSIEAKTFKPAPLFPNCLL